MRVRSPWTPVLAAAAAVCLAPVPAAAGSHDTSEVQVRESVLVFSRTTSFRHASIEIGVEAVRSLGQANGFDVEATEDPAVFTDAGLARHDAVVWLNTSGNVLDGPQRAAFERYVRGGGGWAGVHAAADSEDSSAFHTELLAGARFLAHPVQQPGRLVKELPDHPSTAHLGRQWLLPLEEFYSFTANPRPFSRVLLTIDEGSYFPDPNTSNLPDSPTFPQGVSGVMGDHPMAWCLDVGAGRAWYTALGHEAYLYLTPDFRAHLLGGILTATGRLPVDCSVTAQGGPPAEGPPTMAPPTGAAPGTGAAPPAPALPAAAGPAPRALPVTGGGPVGGGAAAGLLAVALLLALRRRADLAAAGRDVEPPRDVRGPQ